MIFNKLYSEAKSNSVDFYNYKPTTTDEIKNGVRSVWAGAYTGLLAKPATLLGGALVTGAEALDQLAGFENDSRETKFLKDSLAANVKKTQLMQETAQNSGQLNAMLYSISDIVGTFFGAGKISKSTKGMSALAGGVQGYADYENNLNQGIDKATSAEKAAITGATVALGGYVPLSGGVRFAPRAFKGALDIPEAMIGGAAVNTAFGLSSRGFTHDILKVNGYDQIASQYQALDMDAMLVDAALGLIFGGVAKYGEIKQEKANAMSSLNQKEVIDTLLAKNNQLHQEEASPGTPLNIESLNAHHDALNKAFDDMIHGREVDVAHILKDSNFAVKDNADWHSLVLEAITRRYPDVAVFYSKDGVPIPGRVIKDIRSQLEAESNDLIKVTARKKLAEEIHDLNYRANKADKDRLEVLQQKRKSKRGKRGSKEQQEIVREANRLHALAKDLRKQSLEKQLYLKDHTRGGKHFEAKADLSRLEQGIIPPRFVSHIVEQTKLNAENADFLNISDDSVAHVSDTEFAKMQQKATKEDHSHADAIKQILRSKPDLMIKHLDDNGVESVLRASDAFNSVSKELEQAQADKNLYDAAVACLMRST